MFNSPKFAKFLDVSNQANLLLMSFKQLVDKLQSEKKNFETQVEKLKIEKKKMTKLNKVLTNKITMLENDFQRKVSL